MNMCCLYKFRLKHVTLWRNERDMIKICIGLEVKYPWGKVPVILVTFQLKLKFLDRFLEKYLNIKFNENPSRRRRVVPCRQTDEQTDMTKLIVDFCKFCEIAQKVVKIADSQRCSYCLMVGSTDDMLLLLLNATQVLGAGRLHWH